MGSGNTRHRDTNLLSYINIDRDKQSSLSIDTLSIVHMQKTKVAAKAVKYENVENMIGIWLDSTSNELNGDNEHTIIQLQNTINFVKIFDDAEKCLNFINSIQNEKIFLIISGSLGPTFAPLVKNLTQIDSIYIFCKRRSKHILWSRQYHTIKAVGSNIKFISRCILRDVNQCESDLVRLSIVSDNSPMTINERTLSYVFTRLIKEMLCNSKYTGKEHKQLVNYCRESYKNIDHELNTIDEFERNYHGTSSIDWYNRRCFLRFMIAKAFRIYDIQLIIKMGYFIRNLQHEIEQIYSQADNCQTLSVYRAQNVSLNELDNFKRSKGYILSFNSFLSATIFEDVSLENARRGQNNCDTVGILFRIQIDSRNCSTPFVCLEENENNEILFSLNANFTIDAVQEIDTRIWKIDLTLVDEDDRYMKQFVDSIQSSIKPKGDLSYIAEFIKELRRFDDQRTFADRREQLSSEQCCQF